MPKLTLFFPKYFDDPCWAGSSFSLDAPNDNAHGRAGEWVIGRLPTCDITIAIQSVSRRHCSLAYSYAANQWTVTDLGGKNGTRLNGELLEPGDPRPLHIGDKIFLGPNPIHVVEDEQDTIGDDSPTTIASTAPLDHRTGEALPIAPAPPAQTYATALNTGVLWLISPSTRLGAAVRLLIVGMIAAVVVLVMDGEH